MKIAILGWGSLISQPRGLPIAGTWQLEGPSIPIEFSRISQKGERADCLTLVIDERCCEEVVTQYVLSGRSDLEQAKIDLKNPDSCNLADIGYCDVATAQFAPNALKRHPKTCQHILAWARARGFDAVIWTALGCRFKDVPSVGVPFSPIAAGEYLKSLPPPTKERALDYIHNAPQQTMTPFRRWLLEHDANKSLNPKVTMREMKTNWIDLIAAEMHQVWMELYVERDGWEEARKQEHFKFWENLQSAVNGAEAMDQDRFVASLILRAFVQGKIADSAALPPFIHNSVQLWIRLTGEELKAHHVPYERSEDRDINERMKKERTTQAGRVWPILQRINMADVRNCDWIADL